MHALEVAHRHLDAGLTEYEALRPQLAQAEVAAQRISSGLGKARLRGHVAERDALRSLVDATPVGLASLASELRWTMQRREDRTLPHRTRALLAERAAALRQRRTHAQDRDPHSMFAPACEAEDESLPHLEPVCVPVGGRRSEHLVVSVVNVREFAEAGRFTAGTRELYVHGQPPHRHDVLAAARQALSDLA